MTTSFRVIIDARRGRPGDLARVFLSWTDDGDPSVRTLQPEDGARFSADTVFGRAEGALGVDFSSCLNALRIDEPASAAVWIVVDPWPQGAAWARLDPGGRGQFRVDLLAHLPDNYGERSLRRDLHYPDDWPPTLRGVRLAAPSEWITHAQARKISPSETAPLAAVLTSELPRGLTLLAPGPERGSLVAEALDAAPALRSA